MKRKKPAPKKPVGSKKSEPVFVQCPECGYEQEDMGRNVCCEECGFGPMDSPTSDGASL